MERVEILLWLVPSIVVTGVAMLVAGWVGRERPERELSQAEQDRFADAILRPLPTAARPRPGADARSRPRERSTGVAVRRTSTRRSA